MISDIIRPIVSGILGAIGVEWLSKKWRHWIPTGCGRKSKSVIMRESAGRVRAASWLALVGIVAGAGMYLSGYLPSSDWRGIGLTIGLAAGLPLLWLVASSIGGGIRKFQECLVALAISQKTPIPILIGLSALCVAGGMAAAVSLVRSPPSPVGQTEAREPKAGRAQPSD
ncbi:MAG: hypothetical protein ACR2RV_01640 [Verrucomicrobiales bacterium]